MTLSRTSEREALDRAHAMDRFRELLEAAPDAIIEVDSNGIMVFVNAATDRIFGYSRDELLGKPVAMLVPHSLLDYQADHRASYQQAPKPGQILFGKRKDGSSFPAEISLSPIKSADPSRVSAVIRDVSDRQRPDDAFREMQSRLTAELSSAHEQLEIRIREADGLNRLKTEFMGSISHELRTPLHTIIGFSELLAEEVEGALNEKQQRFIGYVQRDALHLLDLINDILDLSRIEAGKLDLRMQGVNATEAIQECLEIVLPAAEAKQIALESRYAEELQLRADPLRFRQILLNLLRNAIKFTPERGKVRIECVRERDIALFSILDTGMGIAEGEQNKIFEKFYQSGPTTKGVKEGTGLGLAITRNLIEEQGGIISVRSELGAGSCFTFSLPLASAFK